MYEDENFTAPTSVYSDMLCNVIAPNISFVITS